MNGDPVAAAGLIALLSALAALAAMFLIGFAIGRLTA